MILSTLEQDADLIHIVEEIGGDFIMLVLAGDDRNRIYPRDRCALLIRKNVLRKFVPSDRITLGSDYAHENYSADTLSVTPANGGLEFVLDSDGLYLSEYRACVFHKKDIPKVASQVKAAIEFKRDRTIRACGLDEILEMVGE